MASSLCRGVICAALVACGGRQDEPGPRRDEDRGPPIRIAFGDCTSSPVPFVSGPRPLPPQAEAGEVAVRGDASTGLLRTAGTGRGGRFGSPSATGTPASGFDDANIFGALLGDDDGSAGGPGQPSHVPTMSSGLPSATGELDKLTIRYSIRHSIRQIQSCYESQLRSKPTLAGTVVVQFYILPSGKVASATASGVDPAVASCIADVIKAIGFPRPRHGGVAVNYPFAFRVAADSPAVRAAPAGSGSAAGPGSGSAAPAPPAVAAPYQPGAHDPLRQVEPALAACLRGAAFGAMTVDLELDPTTGRATRATPATTDARLAACIAAAARTVKLDTPGAAFQRCGFAYGVMPSAAAPTVAITATDIAFNGKVVDHPGAVLADSASSWKIAGLFDALDAWQKQPLPPGDVPIRGPGLLEPIDQTPMKIVTRALSTAYAAAADLVLATQRGAQWVPLRAGIVLPVAPVPLGLGGTWSGTAIANDARPHATNERVHISVYVTRDRIWVGLSRIHQFLQVPGRNFARLEQALKERKALRFFADRTDLEIAGADDVVYGDVVQTIELASKVGFTDWKVVPPAALAARIDL